MLLLHQQRQAYASLMLTLQFSNLNSAKSRICATSDNYRETSGLVDQVNCRNGNYFGRDLASTSAAFSEISDLNLDHTTLELIATCPSISFDRRVTVYPAYRKESLGRRLCFERRIQQTELILASILGDVHKLTICMRH